MNAAEVPDELVAVAKAAVLPQLPSCASCHETKPDPCTYCQDDAELFARHALAAVLPEVQAQTLEAEANEVDREVNERCAAQLVADTRCDDCGLRYEERDQYGCQESGRGHHYDQEELDGRAEPLDAPTFYGDQLRRKAARLRATTTKEPTT